MRPSQFDYHRPTTVAEALALLSTPGEVKAIAGGHSLLPAMTLRLAHPTTLVDIGRLEELKGICREGNTVSVGALSTHADIAASSEIRELCPALSQAAAIVGDPQVRNWGTLGGNLAHADPASDPTTVILAAGAKIHFQGPDGPRTVEADDFFKDLFQTDIRPGELLTSVELTSDPNTRSAYVKLPNPASRYAVVGICVVLKMDASRCSSARVAVGGALPIPSRSGGAESALGGSSLGTDSIQAACDAIRTEFADEIMGDIHASAEYRRAMLGVFLKRAVNAALK